MRKLIVVLSALLLVAVGAGIAWASIPGPDGVIHGCYKTSNPAQGALIAIDSAATCPNGYAALNWSQTGPQGPIGPAGPTGPAGVDGVSGYQVVTNHVDINLGDDVAPGTAGDRMAGVSALCPIGKRPLGGGGGSIGPHLYPGRTDVIVQVSSPSSAGNQEGWKVITRRLGDPGDNGYTVDVWVICGIVS